MKYSHHFIGIGGIGMSALAHVLVDMGFSISGSDVSETPITKALEDRGATVFYQQNGDNIQHGQIVVYSTAIKKPNPELARAKEIGNEVVHRSTLLRTISKNKKRLVVSGAHGKTTTASLLAHILNTGAMQNSFVVGGMPHAQKYHGAYRDGEYFVIEGDESDGSFLQTDPFGAIITNFDIDHMDYWKTEKALIDGYQEFINIIQNPSLLFFNGEDTVLAKMNRINKSTSFGLSEKSLIRATNIKTCRDKMMFNISCNNKPNKNSFDLGILGLHNITNALAVFGLCKALSIPDENILEGFKTFTGVKRRFEFKCQYAGASFYDDYAHHPTEIKALLKMAREIACRNRRLVVIFQPHRHSRSSLFLKKFFSSLQNADLCIVTDIYHAGERESDGISNDAFIKAVQSTNNLEYVERGSVIDFLDKHLKKNDLVITVGAGDITHLTKELV